MPGLIVLDAVPEMCSTAWCGQTKQNVMKPGNTIYRGVFFPLLRGMKRKLFNWTKQDKTCTFSRQSFFSSCVKHKNQQFIQLVLCQLNVGLGGWRKEKGTRPTDVLKKRAWRNLYDEINKWCQKKKRKWKKREKREEIKLYIYIAGKCVNKQYTLR